ncbi:hypothetical protein Raf01_73570 [Rugosimonospora africana]|uniref:Uncharacterized protein n=2 Tax=Rugosimonospora africana TaxID=556532 RepID=A0A8J3QXE3_9ACTN|nr:hypothetical protein Raf01_73570 [Rugosimonospora africana]
MTLSAGALIIAVAGCTATRPAPSVEASSDAPRESATPSPSMDNGKTVPIETPLTLQTSFGDTVQVRVIVVAPDAKPSGDTPGPKHGMYVGVLIEETVLSSSSGAMLDAGNFALTGRNKVRADRTGKIRVSSGPDPLEPLFPSAEFHAAGDTVTGWVIFDIDPLQLKGAVLDVWATYEELAHVRI